MKKVHTNGYFAALRDTSTALSGELNYIVTYMNEVSANKTISYAEKTYVLINSYCQLLRTIYSIDRLCSYKDESISKDVADISFIVSSANSDDTLFIKQLKIDNEIKAKIYKNKYDDLSQELLISQVKRLLQQHNISPALKNFLSEEYTLIALASLASYGNAEHQTAFFLLHNLRESFDLRVATEGSELQDNFAEYLTKRNQEVADATIGDKTANITLKQSIDLEIEQKKLVDKIDKIVTANLAEIGSTNTANAQAFDTSYYVFNFSKEDKLSGSVNLGNTRLADYQAEQVILKVILYLKAKALEENFVGNNLYATEELLLSFYIGGNLELANRLGKEHLDFLTVVSKDNDFIEDAFFKIYNEISCSTHKDSIIEYLRSANFLQRVNVESVDSSFSNVFQLLPRMSALGYLVKESPNLSKSDFIQLISSADFKRKLESSNNRVIFNAASITLPENEFLTIANNYSRHHGLAIDSSSAAARANFSEFKQYDSLLQELSYSKALPKEIYLNIFNSLLYSRDIWFQNPDILRFYANNMPLLQLNKQNHSLAYISQENSLLVSLNKKDSDKMKILHVALDGGFYKIAKNILLNKSYKSDLDIDVATIKSWLNAAIEKDDAKTIKVLMLFMREKNVKSIGYTKIALPLKHAVSSGSIEVTKLFIEAIGIKNIKVTELLHCSSDNSDMKKYLQSLSISENINNKFSSRHIATELDEDFTKNGVALLKSFTGIFSNLSKASVAPAKGDILLLVVILSLLVLSCITAAVVCIFPSELLLNISVFSCSLGCVLGLYKDAIIDKSYMKIDDLMLLSYFSCRDKIDNGISGVSSIVLSFTQFCSKISPSCSNKPVVATDFSTNNLVSSADTINGKNDLHVEQVQANIARRLL